MYKYLFLLLFSLAPSFALQAMNGARGPAASQPPKCEPKKGRDSRAYQGKKKYYKENLPPSGKGLIGSYGRVRVYDRNHNRPSPDNASHFGKVRSLADSFHLARALGPIPQSDAYCPFRPEPMDAKESPLFGGAQTGVGGQRGLAEAGNPGPGYGLFAGSDCFVAPREGMRLEVQDREEEEFLNGLHQDVLKMVGGNDMEDSDTEESDEDELERGVGSLELSDKDESCASPPPLDPWNERIFRYLQDN